MRDFKRVREAYKEFIQKYKEKDLSNPKVLYTFLNDYEKLMEEYEDYSPVYPYLFLYVDTHLDDTKALALKTKVLDALYEDWAEIDVFMVRISRAYTKLKKALKDPRFKRFRFLLEYLFESGKYLLPEEAEKILAIFTPELFRRWKDARTKALANSIAVVKDFHTKKTKRVAFNELVKYIHIQDLDYVDYVDRKISTILKKRSFLATEELNALLSAKAKIDRLRGYKRPDQERIINTQIRPESVDAMLRVVSDNFDVSQLYYRKLCKTLGVEKITYAQRAVKPKSSYRKRLDYADAVDFIREVLKELDLELLEYFDIMLDGKIDVYPKKGKRGGGYNVSFSKNLPIFILLNWTGNLSDMFTLAHEFGHALHGFLAKENQPAHYIHYSLAVAEFASTFMEGLIRGFYLRKHKKAKDALAWIKAGDIVSSVFRQIALYNFELELHSLFRDKGYLDTGQINKLFIKHMQQYMGDSVAFYPRHGFWWVYWPHIRSFFYVYTYAFGTILADALLEEFFRGDKKEAIKKYKRILSAGGSDWVENIFSKVGIDITKPQIWERGVKKYREFIEGLGS